jgi:hypothetical protein
MNANPGIDGLIEGVIIGIGNELMPYLSNERAQATAAMMQSILQAVRQLVPAFATCLIEEHNDMTATLRTMAQLLHDVSGPEADRIRERAATLGQLPDLPVPPEMIEIESAHTDLGRALEASISDLDVLQRAGGQDATAADAALTALRTHLAPRYLRDFQLLSVSGGMLGRG